MSIEPGNHLKMQDFADSTYHRPHDPTVLVPAGSAKPWPVKENGSWDLSEEEPLVAKPSLRKRRGVLALCVCAFTIGSLMIIFSSPYSNEFLAPGPLHSGHAQLLAGKSADRCAACHSGATSSTFGWLAHAFSGASSEHTQSQLCLECHKTSINEAFALNPHNVAPSELGKKTREFQNASFVSKLKMPPVNANHEIACSACHREHKGIEDLKAMTDSQCQSCHQSDYHRFETDHPEFTNWPVASKQKIAFDHSTHSLKHFPGANAVFDCNKCHLDDAWQNAKIQAPFEQACASCHEKKIIDSGANGFAMLSLPMLDMNAIEAQGLSVGVWPMTATGDFDGPLPAAMRLFLMADAEAGPILASKPESFEFADLDPDREADVRDAVTIAWSIKRLLHELSLKGDTAVKRRLELSLGREIDVEELSGILNGMDDHSFAAAARRWFPKLNSEIKARFGELSLSETLSSQSWLAKVRAQDKLAENPLANLENASLQLELLEMDPSPSLPAAAASGKTSLVEPQPQPQPQRQQSVTVPVAGQVLASESPISIVNVVADDTQRSGWMRDDRSLRIFYRPAGHHDLFLKNWIDLTLQSQGAENNPATSSLFQSLTNVNSIGNCRYCHTMERKDDSSLVMNWNASRRDGSVSQFTSFSHRAHLVQPALQDCSHCHKMDLGVSNKDSFASLDGLGHRSNFHAISKGTCTVCHQKGLAESSCTTCHNYHVGAETKVNLIED